MFFRLKDRYERRNPIAILWMAMMDVVGWVLSRICPLAPIKFVPNSRVRKVLLVNPAHIGDVIISTAAIRSIKEWDNSIQVGFVTGSSARMALEGHPGVDHFYIVDHWRLNRSEESLYRKLEGYFLTWWKARRTLAKEAYDLAILLNSFSPNLSSLLWASHIPLRVGYTSAGMASLLNLVLNKPVPTAPEQSIQLQLLEAAGINGASRTWLEAVSITRERQCELGIHAPYIVLHPGTGNPAKAWLTERWQAVAAALCDQGWVVVLTGHGQSEQALAEQIRQSSSVINLVGQLQWREWISLLAGTALVIGVDSAVGHICAALNQPFVGIYSGIGVVSRWSPTGERVRVLSTAMPCSPCHTKPCRERLCITSVSVQEALTIADELLGCNHARVV